MFLTALVFLSGFLLSATAAYYSIIGLISIFPGAKIAIIAMGATLELAKLVAASWLYRNWKQVPILIKSYLTVSVAILMLITSMGIFGFLSKSHLEHQATTTSDISSQVLTLDQTIESREKSVKMIERQLNNIDTSLEKYLASDDVTKGLQAKRRLDKERTALETERKSVESDLIELKSKRNLLGAEIQKQEVEIGPLKYIAELIYGQDAQSHFDSAVRMVIILLIVVFDPLAVILLIAGNFSLESTKKSEPPAVVPLDIKPKRKYTRRKLPPHLDLANTSVHRVEDETYGIEPVEKPAGSWLPSVLKDN